VRHPTRLRSLLLASTALVMTAVPAVASAPTAGTASVGPNVEMTACTPGYSPCIRKRASDVDCYGGSGNGPRYTKPGVVYRVTGSDRYRLDADNDGWGCER
jgi:resuscitation-promoting factor RpfB